MTSKKSIAIIRGTDEDKQRIARVVEQSGLSQQDYLLRVALSGLPADDGSTPQTPDSTLLSTIASQQETIASQQEVIEQLSKKLSKYQDDISSKTLAEGFLRDSDIKYQIGVCVTGSKALDVLQAAKLDRPSKYAPKTPLKLALAHDLLWRIEKTPNGNQHRLTAIAEVPKELLAVLDDSAPLSKLIGAIPCYKQFTELEGWELLSDRERRKRAIDCYMSWDKSEYIEDSIAGTQEYIAGLQATNEKTNTHTPVSEGDIKKCYECSEVPSSKALEVDITSGSADSEVIAATLEADDSAPSSELAAAIAESCSSPILKKKPLASTVTPADSEQKATPLPQESIAHSDTPENQADEELPNEAVLPPGFEGLKLIALGELEAKLCEGKKPKSQEGIKKSLKQVGGEGDKLFRGDLEKAVKVGGFTAQGDGLPWMPLDSSRAYWVQVTPEKYCEIQKSRTQPK